MIINKTKSNNKRKLETTIVQTRIRNSNKIEKIVNQHEKYNKLNKITTSNLHMDFDLIAIHLNQGFCEENIFGFIVNHFTDIKRSLYVLYHKNVFTYQDIDNYFHKYPDRQLQLINHYGNLFARARKQQFLEYCVKKTNILKYLPKYTMEMNNRYLLKQLYRQNAMKCCLQMMNHHLPISYGLYIKKIKKKSIIVCNNVEYHLDFNTIHNCFRFTRSKWKNDDLFVSHVTVHTNASIVFEILQLYLINTCISSIFEYAGFTDVLDEANHRRS